MTRAQILETISTALAGQGNQVDLDGKLPAILESLVSLFVTTTEVDDFEEFDPTTSYSIGDIVRYNGGLKKFTATHTGAWTGTDVAATSVFSILNAKIEALSNE